MTTRPEYSQRCTRNWTTHADWSGRSDIFRCHAVNPTTATDGRLDGESNGHDFRRVSRANLNRQFNRSRKLRPALAFLSRATTIHERPSRTAGCGPRDALERGPAGDSATFSVPARVSQGLEKEFRLPSNYLGHELHGAEWDRLEADRRREPGANWKRWGPYLSERQWGTVREDYSADSKPWQHFPHDHARLRAYRWGEDGLLGICDRECRLCFAPALWNGKDPILKERLFGLSGPEGSHGEDVKECYYYLDSTPTHSYMRALYKYPQEEFPYDDLLAQNRLLSRLDPEFELTDTNIFRDHRYFDVEVEYAKAGTDDILIRLTIHNRAAVAAPLHVLPTFWFRNTWVWGCTHEGCSSKPRIWRNPQVGSMCAEHETLQRFLLWADVGPDGQEPRWIFTDNDTNHAALGGTVETRPYVKDAFHRLLINGQKEAVSPHGVGTKAAPWYTLDVPSRSSVTLRLRMTAEAQRLADPAADFDAVFAARRAEADDFYRCLLPDRVAEEEQRVMRQAYAGLLWTKQFYHIIVKDWLTGDPEMPQPPASRKTGRNFDWPHLFNRDVISMPDKWEYPWYAAWDSAFHMVPFAALDPKFAKDQLLLFLREWYMHPNGQIPAYEWNFSDVNPPVHAWSCWRVFELSGTAGERDHNFLQRVFQKLLLNFTWWVNRKDIRGEHVFAGGFLGLDNIGVFDRSKPLPTGGHLEQADGTAWMAFYCSSMLSIALELAGDHQAYGDMASKFFEHYVAIANAMNTIDGSGLWDEEDGFYYDHLKVDGRSIPLKIRSVVGLIPLITVDVLYENQIKALPGFYKRLNWFLDNTPHIAEFMSCQELEGEGAALKRLLAIPTPERMKRLLAYMLDENEFLSPYGIRSLSKVHEKRPFIFHAGGQEHRVRYVPGDSDSWMFGGNSNWRGPVWFPINYLLIESLERYHEFYGDEFLVECPTGSGNFMHLGDVAKEIARRLISLFLPDAQHGRPCHGGDRAYASHPHWRDLVLFYEYFHGDNGRGLGASHQTGWTALVASLLQKLHRGEQTA